jgi:hypothetical protein
MLILLVKSVLREAVNSIKMVKARATNLLYLECPGEMEKGKPPLTSLRRITSPYDEQNY